MGNKKAFVKAGIIESGRYQVFCPNLADTSKKADNEPGDVSLQDTGNTQRTKARISL